MLALLWLSDACSCTQMWNKKKKPNSKKIHPEGKFTSFKYQRIAVQ